MSATKAHRANKTGWSTMLHVYIAAFFVFMYGPILLLFALSFNDSQLIGLPFKGFTTRWYGEVANDATLIEAVINSVSIGIVSSLIAVALALSLALAFKRDLPFKGLLFNFILLPIIIPGLVSGIVMLIGAGYAGVRYGLWTTTLVTHVTWVLPFAFLTLYPRVTRLDPALEEAAMDLGAPPRIVFRRVTLPLIQPSIVATALFAFTLSFDEFIRTLFVIGNVRTVPVYLWTLVIEQAAPFLPAVGVTMMAVSIAVALLGFVFSARTAPAEDGRGAS
ncbi:ABC transporter permease [Acuticoccus kandeliae]|uniref:ABC transporter permease n=1 Tax=Acuticoccus kandeliae TaxID=2073160 RepID=UPI000D3EA227|nr:ABC transporter permease [Acuticoccus kandeliae]